MNKETMFCVFLAANLVGKFVWWIASHSYHLMFPSGLL